MDLHDNLALSTTITDSQHQGSRPLSDRDRESLHRAFNEMRRALVGTSHHFIAAVPHP